MTIKIIKQMIQVESNKVITPKRSKGKNNSSLKLMFAQGIFNKYNQMRTTPKVTHKLFNNFTSDMLKEFADALVHGYEIKLPTLGRFRVYSYKRTILKKNGEFNRDTPIDWKSTRELWGRLYPHVNTIEELKAIENKPMIRFDSEVGYGFLWDKLTVPLENKTLYEFKVNRSVRDRLKEVILDPNKEVYYYGR